MTSLPTMLKMCRLSAQPSYVQISKVAFGARVRKQFLHTIRVFFSCDLVSSDFTLKMGVLS